MVLEGDRLLEEQERLIVALDVPDEASALSLVDRLSPTVTRFKVGLQLYTACGASILDRLRERGVHVFLDLKLHDIPNTVASAMQSALRPGVFMTTVHASGGRAMLEAAVSGARQATERHGFPIPRVIGVSVLTHLSHADLTELGVPHTPEEQARRLARLCQDCGLDGVVASPDEVHAIREETGPGFLIVTPGIRPPTASKDDQTRVATPTRAIRAGASYLVVGRPITAASDPAEAAAAVIREMQDAFLIA